MCQRRKRGVDLSLDVLLIRSCAGAQRFENRNGAAISRLAECARESSNFLLGQVPSANQRGKPPQGGMRAQSPQDLDEGRTPDRLVEQWTPPRDVSLRVSLADEQQEMRELALELCGRDPAKRVWFLGSERQPDDLVDGGVVSLGRPSRLSSVAILWFLERTERTTKAQDGRKNIVTVHVHSTTTS
jgi:hypothetical protein